MTLFTSGDWHVDCDKLKGQTIEVNQVDLSEDNAFGFCQFDGEEFLIHIHNDLVPTEYFKTLAHELIHVRQTLEGLTDHDMRESEAYIWEDILSKDFWDSYQSDTFFCTAWTKPSIIKA